MKAFTVYYDPDGGEITRITYTGDFNDESDLLQADVLRDALHWLELEYQAARLLAFPLRLADLPTVGGVQ